jgi:hypothetical protein
MKKYLIATVVAVAVFAGSAFAASLNVDAGTLQAGQGEVGACASDDVEVAYSTPTFADGNWTVSQITLHYDVNCDGLDYSVVVTGTTDAVPWETDAQDGTFDGDPEVVTFDAGFDAEDAAHVHLVIHTATSSTTP